MLLAKLELPIWLKHSRSIAIFCVYIRLQMSSIISYPWEIYTKHVVHSPGTEKSIKTCLGLTKLNSVIFILIIEIFTKYLFEIHKDDFSHSISIILDRKLDIK